MPGDFWTKIRNLYRNTVYPQPRYNLKPEQRQQLIPSAQPRVPAPNVQQVGPMDMASKMSILNEAGKRRLMVRMKYDGQVRLVEPYSFRDKATGMLFFGWCSIHSKIHSFKPEKIESLELTEIAFMPRWEVELG